MGISNLRKGSYNIIFGLLSQIITIALGIVIPRLFLVNYGSEVNGLLNSVSQIYVYMGLLEAGLGTITLQALYKPVGMCDRQSISSILSAADKYYKKVGIYYICGVFVLSFIYPIVVKSTIPFFTISAVIFMNGIANAVSFYFQAKYKILMQAEGKYYVLTNISLICHIFVSFSKIACIIAGLSVIAIQFVYMAFNFAQIFALSLFIKKNYPWVDLTAEPDIKALSQKNAAFIHQVSDMIFRNTDVIVLSVIPTCGLMVVSVYTMYNMLLGMITTAINTLTSGVEFILGQTFNVDRKKYLVYHDIYEVYSMALIFALFSIAYIFILPFLSLYTAGVSDISYLDKLLPLLFVITLFLSAARRASAVAINYAKHFKQTQTRAIIEAVINISISIPAAYAYGIYGVLFGTIAALLYRTNDMIVYANHVILHRSCLSTYKRWIINTLLFITIVFLKQTWILSITLNSYLSIVLWAVIGSLVIVPTYIVIASLVDLKVFKNLLLIVREILHAKRRNSN